MLKMFSTAAFLCATLIPIFSHAQPYMIPGNPNMMSLPRNTPSIMPQQIPLMTPDIQGYLPMQPGPLMPSQRMLQDYQPPIPDNSLQQQLLLLIMSACNRLMTYIQLLANQMKVPQYNPLTDPTGPNMNPTPGPMPYSPQLSVEAQQSYNNQFLLQQHQQQAQYQQQLLDEERQLQEEGHKQEELEKTEEPNSKTKNEVLKKQQEKETKITPQDLLKIQSTRDQRRRLSRTATNNTSDVEPTSYSNDMHIETEFIPNIYANQKNYEVFQTSPENIGSFYNNQDVEQNMGQINKPQQQKQLLQINNQELNKGPRYEDRISNQQYINPIKSLDRNLKTQIPTTPDSYPLYFETGLQYQHYLFMKLLEKKHQFKQKQEKELKQPWKNLKDRSKFLQSLYLDHLVHQEYDHDEFEKKKQSKSVNIR